MRAVGLSLMAAGRDIYPMPAGRLAEMKAEGWSLSEMAGEFGCNFSTISLGLRRLGLP
jgi:hypothetical protein